MSYLDYMLLDHNPFNDLNWQYDAYNSIYLKQVKDRIFFAAQTQSFSLITGKSSSGVTRSIYEAIKDLSIDEYRVMYISCGKYKSFDFYNLISDELGLFINGYSKASVKASIQKALANIITKEDQKPVFIIDNAHLLDKEVLYDMSIFYDFGLESGMQVCLILAGNDILRGKIRSLELDSLADRIATNYKVKYLSAKEIGDYIKSQLPNNQYPLEIINEEHFLNEIHTATQGNYRKINMLMTNLLILAKQKQLKCFTVDDVYNARNEMFFC